MKPLEDPRSYRSISLLCTFFKILERLIYTSVKLIIDPLLRREQAGFRRGRYTVDQVTFLTQEIKDNYSAKKKAVAVFIHLTAVYDTVWHRGWHMTSLITKRIRNRSFTFTTGTGSQSRLRSLKNGVPQGSDLPVTAVRKFSYADDLEIRHSTSNWKTLKETLSQDIITLFSYLQI